MAGAWSLCDGLGLSTPDSGNQCFDNRPAEGVDTPGDVGLELRFGCYVDGNGRANARFLFASETQGQSVYIGAVAKNGRIPDLFNALFPAHESGQVGCVWCAGDLFIAPGESH